MKKLVFIVTTMLLLFNGFGAMYGGLSLVADPSGEQLKLPLSVLQHTPFGDFLIPGIVLLVVNGVFSLLVFIAMLFGLSKYPLLVVAEGCLLTGWIVVQHFWTQMYHPLQAIMGTVGLLLISCGYLLLREERVPARFMLS